MTINNMALVEGSIVAECVCDGCGYMFNIDWQYRIQAIYCPECNEKVLPGNPGGNV
ncbi:hypothetical protein [Methanolobus halotolerans]|uniref:hypothetical protein n=1 Tax=Methanolobus halotolerans TaxID=2052935 RepID=UPI001436A77F|nr:hypothetical protein [Methanolobus halotolerans]